MYTSYTEIGANANPNEGRQLINGQFEYLYSATSKYAVYSALISQTSTDAPTAIVLENTLGGTVSWSYDSEGHYSGTLTGAFTTGKTFITTAGGSELNACTFTNCSWLTSNEFLLHCINVTGATYSDGLMLNTPLEIRVYS